MKAIAIVVCVALLALSPGCKSQAKKYEANVEKLDATAQELCAEYEAWVALLSAGAGSINDKAKPISSSVVKAARKACGAVDVFVDVDAVL